MTTRVLGRVAPLYKGNYSNSTNYIKFDVVFDGESSFISKQGTAEAPNVGHALTDEAWWGLLCKGNYLSIQPLTERVTEIEADLSELEQEQIQGGVYDVSSHSDGAVFESLSDLLGSANLSTLIPTSVRRGGMSIRFIQGSVPNSDNKYVQGRCMANAFTTDVAQWQVDVIPTDFDGTDLDLSDAQGNVIVKFAEGNIETKNSV